MPKAEVVDVKEPKDVKRVAAGEGIGKPTGEPIELAPTAGPKNLDKLPFFDMLAAMTPREWEDRLVYLYRQDKNIIKEDPKDNNYIDRIGHAFDEAYVKQKFGGGRFLAILKNTRIVNGAERKFSFRIEGEPIIQDGELQIKKKEAAGSGSSEVTMLLDQVRDLTDKLLTQGQKSTGAEQVAITKSVEMLTEASKGALAIQQEAIKSSMSSSTGNPLTDKLLEATIAKLAGGEQKGDDLERMVKLLALLKQLNPAPEAKPGLMGIVSELKGLAEVAKELGMKIGGGGEGAVVEGAGGMDWKTALAANIPSVLGTLTGWFQEWQKSNAERNRLMAMQVEAMRRGQVPPQQLPPAPPVQTSAPATTAIIAPPPPAQPAAAPASALPTNFAPGGSQPATATPPPAADKVVEFPQKANTVQVDLSFVAGLVRRCFDKGDPGDAAALVIKRLFDDAQLKEFQPYFNDVEQLKVIATIDPQLAEIVNDEDFPVFLAEFVREMRRKEHEEEDEQPGPEAGA